MRLEECQVLPELIQKRFVGRRRAHELDGAIAKRSGLGQDPVDDRPGQLAI
jgi:hypothetical protein